MKKVLIAAGLALVSVSQIGGCLSGDSSTSQTTSVGLPTPPPTPTPECQLLASGSACVDGFSCCSRACLPQPSPGVAVCK